MNPSILLPKKNEWGLLYEHQYKQNQLNQLLEKQRQKLRQQAVKNGLDQQLRIKKDYAPNQKAEDNQFLINLLQKQRKAKEAQIARQRQRILKRKLIQEQNQRMIKNYKGYEKNNQDSEQTRSKNSSHYNPNFLNLLQMQIIEKDRSKSRTKNLEVEQELKDMEYWHKKEIQRKKQLDKFKSYHQNMDVYEYYSKLNNEKNRNYQLLTKKLVVEADIINNKKQKQLQKETLNQKIKKTIELKDTLLQQIELHQKARLKRTDSQRNSQQSLSPQKSVEDSPRKTFDKQQYLNFLKMQDEQQKRKKKSEKYMSEQEFKFNLNHINKLVDPTVENAHRSIISIGHPQDLAKHRDNIYFSKQLQPSLLPQLKSQLSTNMQNTIEQEDSQILRTKIESIKNYSMKL